MEIKELQPQPALSIRATTPASGIGQTLGVVFPEVWAYSQESGAVMAGPPFARYYSFTDSMVDLAGGMPVTTTVNGNDRVSAEELPGGRFATAWHIGPYDKLSETWQALESWINEQGLEAGDACWEVYWTDPREVKDPAEYRTEIYWGVK